MYLLCLFVCSEREVGEGEVLARLGHLAAARPLHRAALHAQRSAAGATEAHDQGKADPGCPSLSLHYTIFFFICI